MARRSLTIRVGELFAEVCDSSVSAPRWFLPKKPLADAIKEKIDLSKYDEINFQLLFRKDALPTDRFSQNKVAMAVTSGFEGAFAGVLSEKNLPFSSDFIFGISERVSSSGTVLKQVDRAELDLIAQKLKLMKVEQLLVGTLNSHLNADNQNEISAYFRDQGLKVFTSSSQQAGENKRWSELVEQAQWQHLIEDLEEQISEVVKNLNVSFEKFNEVKFSTTTLFAGLDIFWVTGTNQNCTELESQPSDVVEPGFFDSPEFRHFPQRNGPLLLGKSMRPTALDLFLLEDPSFQVEGLLAAQFDRMKSRIEEALAVMSKGQQQGSSRIDGAKVANDALNIFITALAGELRNFGIEGSLKIEGPLSHLVLKHLKQIDLNLKCELGAQA